MHISMVKMLFETKVDNTTKEEFHGDTINTNNTH